MITISVASGTEVDTLSKAIALLPEDDGQPVCIHLAPGIYREKVTLSRANTILEGSGAEQTKVVFDDGERRFCRTA